MEAASPKRGILVAGGSGGIGHAVVAQLRGRGYRIGVIDKSPPQQEVDAYVRCEFSETGTIRDAVITAGASLGAIDGLVLCAGRYEAATFDTASLESFCSAVEVNLVSQFALVKAWVEICAVEDAGVVVVVGSAAGHIGSRDPGYSASKAGLLGLCRSLAMNLTERGFSVFSVSPGVVKTQMSDRQPAERREQHISRTLLKRAADPSEVARVITWLVETRPHYMSGADLNLSSGLAW